MPTSVISAVESVPLAPTDEGTATVVPLTSWT